jgi:hypothetical protein
MLPKLDVPMFELVLPLTKKKVKFRPFLVKEEKILLMAMESEDDNATSLAIKQIVNNCLISDNVDIETMPVLDLEYLFLNLRARSIGEVIDLQYKCNNKVKDDAGEEKECGAVIKMPVNLLEIEPVIPETHKNKIEFSPVMGMIMRYPSFKSIENEGSSESTEVERVMNILVSCVESIYDADSIFYAKDIPQEELVEFIENLTRDQFVKVQEFFDTMPKISKKLHFGCKKCGYEEDITVEGLQNFFV